jgi:hypothetical protein
MTLGLTSSNRNEFQEYFLRGKGGRCVGLTLPLLCAHFQQIWETQPPGILRACPDLYRYFWTFTFTNFTTFCTMPFRWCEVCPPLSGVPISCLAANSFYKPVHCISLLIHHRHIWHHCPQQTVSQNIVQSPSNWHHKHTGSIKMPGQISHNETW